jgi:imidazolonepropionase-like amidohydrolase
MAKENVALIPTLKLWRWELERHAVPAPVIENYVADAVAQLAAYHAIGGEVLFGTDVGYLTDFDTSEEFELMAQAGLDYRAILNTLTVAPARRFLEPGAAPALAGVVEAGAHADLVILEGDPAADVRAFARPAITIRRGRVVYPSP